MKFYLTLFIPLKKMLQRYKNHLLFSLLQHINKKKNIWPTKQTQYEMEKERS